VRSTRHFGLRRKAKVRARLGAVLAGAYLATACAGAATDDARVKIIKNGKEIAFPADRCSALTSNVVAFVHSASVNLTRWSGKPAERDKEWEKLMKSDSFIHIVFTKPATISLMRADHQGREEKSVSQILITLPPNQWPSVCVKSDGTVICFTKYDPFVLKELVSEPALGLSSVPPYDSLIKHTEKRKARKTE